MTLQHAAQTISRTTVFNILEEDWFHDQLEKALPSFMTRERLIRMSRTELKRKEKLQKCDPLSVAGTLIQCAELGLAPGDTLGHVYLIPFYNRHTGKTECQIMMGYRGMLELARRSGQVKAIEARVVYENDDFKLEYGLNPKLRHIPATEAKGKVRCVYAIARLLSGERQIEMMTLQEIEHIKALAKKSDNDIQSIWQDHFEEMARKTIIRRLFKYLPVSLEMTHAIGLDEQVDKGVQENVHEVENKVSLPETNVVSFPAPLEPLPKQPQTKVLTPTSQKEPSSELQQFVDNLAKFNKGVAVQSSIPPKTALDLMRERLDEQKRLQQVKGREALERLKRLKLTLQSEGKV